MATVHLEPDDVPAFEAGRVLAALNAAPDAAWLAAAIEFPNEPDIGRRLGQRLIDRRDELGGFTSLAQVDDVPPIDPERFTRIVVGLSGRVALDYLQVPSTGPRGWSGTPGALGLRLLTAGPWLGQLTTVVATGLVGGVRRPGVELVVAAGVGRLRAVSGGRVLAGATVTLVTGADGVARATWLPPATPSLDPAGAAALADTLGQLPSAGDTPAASGTALEALVAAYRWEPNEALRRAVDGLTGDVGLDADAVDPSADWPTVETTITAWTAAGTDAPDGSTEAVAVQPLVTRDWRPALLRTYRDVLAGQARLASHLVSEQRAAADAGDLVGRVQTRVGAFLDVQQGRLGRAVARTIAADTGRAFVVDHTADLALDDALQVAPVLGATAATAGTSAPSVVQALATTRATVLDRVDTAVAGPLHARLDLLDGTVATKVDQSTLQSALADKLERSELDAVLASTVSRDEFRTALRDTLTRAVLDDAVAGLVGKDQLAAALSDKLDRAALDNALAGTVSRDELTRALSDKLDHAALDRALAGTVSRDELARALGGKLDRSEVDDLVSRLVGRDELDRILSTRPSRDEFKAFAERVETRFRRLEG